MEIFSRAIATPDSLADRVARKIASLMLIRIRKAIPENRSDQLVLRGRYRVLLHVAGMTKDKLITSFFS